MTFPYMLTIYLGVHPHHPSPSSPYTYNYFDRFLFFIFIQVYKVHWSYSPSPSHWSSLPNRTCFTFLSFIILAYVQCSKRSHHGIPPVNTLCFNHSNPSYYTSLPFLPTTCYSTAFSAFYYAFFLHRHNVICTTFWNYVWQQIWKAQIFMP
jgi:hypothetical protein